jgi:hypothetical protein
MGQRRVDRVFRDIALRPEIVRPVAILRQPAALPLHLVRGLPGLNDDFADPAHCLAVGGHHAERAEIVQDVLGGDRLAPDPALGESDILGEARVEVMADHLDHLPRAASATAAPTISFAVLGPDPTDLRRIGRILASASPMVPGPRPASTNRNKYLPMGGQMNDAHFAPTARYLLQIASNGEWKIVAYLNDFEEAKRTIDKVPAARVFDTWKQAEVQLHQRLGVQSEARRIKRLSREDTVRALGSRDR